MPDANIGADEQSNEQQDANWVVGLVAPPPLPIGLSEPFRARAGTAAFIILSMFDPRKRTPTQSTVDRNASARHESRQTNARSARRQHYDSLIRVLVIGTLWVVWIRDRTCARRPRYRTQPVARHEDIRAAPAINITEEIER